MNSYILKFKLKQHTPIIHFQHDQHGATLRASELKPKFDKFLIEKLGGIEKLRQEHSDWFINKEHKALDYKVRVECEHENKEIDLQEVNKDGIPKTRFNKAKNINEPIIKSFPMFFASMGAEWDKNKKEFSFNKKTKISFTCFNKELLENIKEYFPLFIFLTNFGTRQNKGFGSYYIDEKDESYKPPIDIIRSSNINLWKFSFSIDEERDINVVNSYKEYQTYYKLFDKINDFYKAIRSGINLSFLNPPFYLKSLLYVYATLTPNITWAKKAIKNFHFNSYTTAHSHLHPVGTATPFLFRDLLGLSTLQEWKIPYEDTITKEDLQKDSHNNPTNDEKIERFKSPITFIPIQNSKNENQFTIYLYTEKINTKLLDRKFEIISKNLAGQEIATPISFNIDDYLDFLTSVDLSKIVDSTMHRHWYYRKLTSLISSFNRIKI